MEPADGEFASLSVRRWHDAKTGRESVDISVDGKLLPEHLASDDARQLPPDFAERCEEMMLAAAEVSQRTSPNEIVAPASARAVICDPTWQNRLRLVDDLFAESLRHAPIDWLFDDLDGRPVFPLEEE
jgi:hypothetical protein